MSQKQFRPSLPTIQSSYYGSPYSHQNNDGMSGGMKERLGDLLGSNNHNLPLYKDKPSHTRSRKKKNQTANKVGLVILAIMFMAWMTGLLPGLSGLSYPLPTNDANMWTQRREAVREAFVVSWDSYAEHAWGMDEYHPIAQSGRNMGCKPNTEPCPPVGWMIVDGLDTAIMMNLTSRVARAREWISTSLDFSKPDSDTNTFETTIRVLGGLLSAHYLSIAAPELARQKPGGGGEDLYVEKAVDLADRLLGAYDTPSGIPLSSVVLKDSQGVRSWADMGASSTAEATTLQLEMKYVAKLTGEPLYWIKAEEVMKAIDAPRREGGLLPIFVDAQTGAFQGENIRLGSRGDSYYEYLIKQFLQTGSREIVYSEMWEEALEGMKKHLITWSTHGNLTVVGERQAGLGEGLTGKMDHLVCFLPGTIALGVTGGATVSQAKEQMGSAWGKKQEEDLLLAAELMKTCWGMYVVTPTGLAAELSYLDIDGPSSSSSIRTWNFTDSNWTMPRSVAFDPAPDATWRKDYQIKSNDVHNLQRPETVESLFYMWRITGDVKYREWGWQMFQAFATHTAVHDEKGKVVGYTSIDSVTKVNHDYANTNTRGELGSQIMVGNRKGAAHRDNMEGFWLAETLKYFYLLFTDEVSDWNDLEKIVINTEAHFFPRFDIGTEGKPWKTGWQRQPRTTVSDRGRETQK